MKETINNIFKKRIILCLLSFIVPFIIMVIGGAVISIAPFGKNGFLVSDINAQFAAFFTYWKDTFLSGSDNFTYSLTKTLGGDMTGFSGYYLNNPYLLILLLFPSEKITIGIYWMLTLCVSSMGLTFELMLDNKYDADYRHLIFSWGYALSGYTMAFLTLPIYSFALVLFPIVIMGIDMMKMNNLDKKKIYKAVIVYILSLALLIWSNYYLGYMVCIFCGLYFIVSLLDGSHMDKKSAISYIFSFSISSLLAVILVSPVLVSIVKSLSGQKTSSLSVIKDFQLSYRPGALVFNLLPGQFRCDFTNLAAPYIYVGLVVLVCVALFFLSPSISIRKKISHGLLFAFLMLSSFITGLDNIWHGLNSPVGFPHRQAFIIVAYLLIMGAEAVNSINIKSLLPKLAVVLPIAAIFIQLGDLSYNTIASLKAYQSAEMNSQQDYEEYYVKNKAIIEKISSYSPDNTLYRIEKDYSRNHNDAMMLSYNGLSHNSSCEKEYVKTFMGRMGFRNQGIWASYQNGSTSYADSLLGVKYFISRFDETNKPYEKLFAHEESYVFENPYALNLAWTDKLAHTNSVDLTNPDLFEIQNQMAKYEIYTPAEYEMNCQGMTHEELKTTDAYFLSESTDNILGVKNTGSGTHSTLPTTYSHFEAIPGDTDNFIEYSVHIDKDCNLYCYFAAPVEQGVLLYINGCLWDDYFSDYRWGIVNCGNYVAGDTVTVSLYAAGEAVDLYNAYFYQEDIEMLSKWYGNTTSKDISVNKISSSHYTVKNDCNATGDDLMIFSIPYEDNWSITIDGEKADPVMVYECLMGIELPNFWNEIDMVFK